MAMPEPAKKPAHRRLTLAGVALLGVAALMAVLVVALGGDDEPSKPAAAAKRAAPSGRARPEPAPRQGKPLLFAPTSVWNATLPADAAVDPNSPRLMKAFLGGIANERKQGIGPWIQTGESSTPLYTVGRDVPRVRVDLGAGSWGDSLRSVLDRGVPIPKGAQPAAGTDHHLTIYQPSTDSLWEFWHAEQRPAGWHADWGGAIRHVSSDPGYFTTAAWPGHSQPNWGSTATSLPVIGGTILMRELRRGRIDHALALDIAEPRAGQFAWPAQRTDGRGPAEALPEGARLRLDPRLDLGKLDLPPVTRMLAEAAQRHGIVVRDRTAHATAFYAEAPSADEPDAYGGPNGLFGGLAPNKILDPFPFDRLQVLRMNLCSHSPCPRGDSP